MILREFSSINILDKWLNKYDLQFTNMTNIIYKILLELDDISPQPKTAKLSANKFLTKLSITSAIGGFLLGYDTGVVSGALLLVDDRFNLGTFEHELVVTITIDAVFL